MTETTMRDRILDAAEARARTVGYNGFSFRDVATDVGVKSASVHYHFPTKAELGAALAARYAERAASFLALPDIVAAAEAVARMRALFEQALRVDDRMCLCGLFGAERDALPPTVDAQVAAFFHMLLAYLDAAFARTPDYAGPPAPAVVAQLEGALILARTLRDPALFDAATEAMA